MPGVRTNCSPNSYRKCRRNVPRIFDVCSELKSDCKSYFGFLVDKFSEAVLKYRNYHVLDYCVTRLPVMVSSKKECRQFFLLPLRKMPDRRLSKLRIPLLQIHNNLNNRFAFFTSNTPNTFRLDFQWAFSEQF